MVVSGFSSIDDAPSRVEAVLSPLCYHRSCRRFGRHDTFDYDRLVARRRNEMKLLSRQLFNSFRRLERFDFEPKLPRRFFLRRTFALHLFEPVAVTQNVELLPGPYQQDHDKESCDAHGLPELALSRVVDFADDWVVPHVLFDGVFE